MNRRARWVVVAALSGAGCGSSPTSVSPPVPVPPAPVITPWAGANLTGVWTGAWTYTVDTLLASDQATVTFAANGATMDGRIATAAGVGGTISMTTPSPLGGTLLITVTLLSGGTCSGTGAATATLNGDELRVTTASLSGVTATCPTWATNHLFVLKK